MARPAEKARSMMNKWTAMRNAEAAPVRKPRKRPHLASEVDNLADAERFRGQIIREITDMVAKIQNPALPEHEIRELNDEINRKMREKWHFNKRIVDLGGLDFNAIEKKRQIEEGDTQIASGYRYFGAAKDLPGVKELLSKEEAKKLAPKKSDLHKHITPDYYGWRDEEDGVLLELEAKVDKEYESERKKQRMGENAVGDYLDLLSEDHISKFILEHKKKALLEKYAL